MIYCPVDCKYCLLSKIEKRRAGWDNGKRIGVNNTNVFLGRLPGDPPMDKMGFDFPILENDFVGFGIVDCFWDKFRDDLKFMLDNLDNFKIKKLVLISKIPVDDELVSLLKDKRVLVVYSMTGLDKYTGLENTTTVDRFSSMEKLVKARIDTFPLIHPFIMGVSDVSFLSNLRNIGITDFGFKGFRYNKETMPEVTKLIGYDTLKLYETTNEDEVCFGAEKLHVSAYTNKLEIKTLKDRVLECQTKEELRLSKDESIKSANHLFSQLGLNAHICSSTSNKDEVFINTVKRRMI
jgi:hypothetical protein